jgi:hypothetical protein
MIVGVLLAAGLFAGNVQLPAALVFFGLCAFVITTIVSEFW